MKVFDMKTYLALLCFTLSLVASGNAYAHCNWSHKNHCNKNNIEHRSVLADIAFSNAVKARVKACQGTVKAACTRAKQAEQQAKAEKQRARNRAKGGQAKQLEKRVIQEVKREMSIFKKNSAFMQWTFEGGPHGKPIYGGVYQLFNLSANSGIVRQKRSKSRAANLGWGAGRHITVQKSGRGPLRYGDTIAMRLKNYGWLKYHKRGRAGGINLGAPSKGTKFNWVIGGGTRGGIVNVGQPFTLKNKTINRLVRHCGRTFGIDLNWSGKRCGSIWAKISNGIWGKNGSPNLKGRFCKGAIASGRAAAAIKTLGKSEAAGTVAGVMNKVKKVCSYL